MSKDGKNQLVIGMCYSDLELKVLACLHKDSREVVSDEIKITALKGRSVGYSELTDVCGLDRVVTATQKSYEVNNRSLLMRENFKRMYGAKDDHPPNT